VSERGTFLEGSDLTLWEYHDCPRERKFIFKNMTGSLTEPITKNDAVIKRKYICE
jgi:hypothetical protein